MIFLSFWLRNSPERSFDLSGIHRITRTNKKPGKTTVWIQVVWCMLLTPGWTELLVWTSKDVRSWQSLSLCVNSAHEASCREHLFMRYGCLAWVRLHSYRAVFCVMRFGASLTPKSAIFFASRIGSQQLSAASYLCHIGHYVKFGCHPWILLQSLCIPVKCVHLHPTHTPICIQPSPVCAGCRGVSAECSEDAESIHAEMASAVKLVCGCHVPHCKSSVTQTDKNLHKETSPLTLYLPQCPQVIFFGHLLLQLLKIWATWNIVRHSQIVEKIQSRPLFDDVTKSVLKTYLNMVSLKVKMWSHFHIGKISITNLCFNINFTVDPNFTHDPVGGSHKQCRSNTDINPNSWH